MYPILAQADAEVSGLANAIILVSILGFWFAIVVAVVVYRRGLKDWGIGTGLVSLVPVINIVVPIMALRQGSPEPGMLVEPCPGCGDHQGYADHGVFDRESEEPVPHPVAALISGLLGAGVAIGAVLLAISIWSGGDKSCSGGLCIEWENGAIVAGIAFLLVGLWLASLAGRWALAYVGADKVEGTAYRCAGCDKRWLRFDQGLPQPV